MAKRTRPPARRRTPRKTARQAYKATHQTQPPQPALRHVPSRRRPVGVAIEYTPELLENARQRFEKTDELPASIAADLGVHRNTFRLLILRRGWKRRVPLRDLPPALKLLEQAKRLKADEPLQSGQQAQPAPRDPEDQTPGSVAEQNEQPAAADVDRVPKPAEEQALPPMTVTVERLHRAVLAELAAVETMRAALKREPQNPVDAERTARTLASLTETLQKLQRMQCAMPQTGSHDDDWPADADEFRNELARRINAFVASRTGDSRPSAV